MKLFTLARVAWESVPWYSLNTSVITPFFKVPTLGFGHVNGHLALCTHRFVFSGAVRSAALYSMLSLCFETASDRAKWSNLCIRYPRCEYTTIFCQYGTRAQSVNAALNFEQLIIKGNESNSNNNN